MQQEFRPFAPRALRDAHCVCSSGCAVLFSVRPEELAQQASRRTRGVSNQAKTILTVHASRQRTARASSARTVNGLQFCHILRNTLSILILTTLFSSVCAASCNISATPVAFGSYSPFSTTPLDSTGTITVNCTPANTPFSIALESGLQGGINSRRMRGNTSNDQLFYNLYTEASRSIIWGNGTGNSQKISGNTNNTLIVYGRIPAQQNGGVGSYSDSVTIAIDF